MPRLPYFPLYPHDYLLDEKIESLTVEEEGVLHRLWYYMWINKIKRGHLLYDSKTPISDEQLAKRVKLLPEKWVICRDNLLKSGLVVIGNAKELFSRRLSKYKTPYELENSDFVPKHPRTNPKSSIPNLTIPNLTIPKSSLPNKKESNDFIEFFNTMTQNLPKVSILTAKRKAKISLRLKEHPDLEWWKQVFLKAAQTRIPNKNSRGDWRPTFDWLIDNDNNAVKVFEGNYDHQKHSGLKAWAQEQEEKYGKG